MTDRIGWVDNLRAIACLMVVMVHSAAGYVTDGSAVGTLYWNVANLLDSASRVCVPLFFMISGYLFFGERQAQGKHYLRIGCCLLFYSLLALCYMAWLTPINPWLALRDSLQKPVFYHLWFFYAITIIYLFSPLIKVRQASGYALAAAIVLLAVVANPNMPALMNGQHQMLPVNLYMFGDTIYYLLYAITGRIVGMMTIPRWAARVAFGVFVLGVALVTLGTRHLTLINGDFDQTYYLYCGPLVFLAASGLLASGKYYLNAAPLPGLALIARHSLAIYGVHALVIHYLRTHQLALESAPVTDIFYVFAMALAVGLLFSLGLQRIDRRRLVS
ncbi:acyltransferase [Lonsdalea quercina]|uniref:acyltransferase n=1 Tax=Lonsdalea quercina TaxID=71657 RepID=UPI00397558DE